MALTAEQANELIDAWVTDQSLRAHLRDVSHVMRCAALSFGREAEADTWALAGLLHDADWQTNPSSHPDDIVRWLRDRGENDLAAAIATHNSAWGTAVSAMAKSLLAFDELTGFIGAVAKVNPEGIGSVSVSSVLKKLKKRSFAASVDRNEVELGAAGIDMSLEHAIEFVLKALQAP